ncbi:unnamed protein product [Adineta ricciae]|uniref:Nostrin-like protein n=1 Tax=Adineta ricciae TaxID=249248 RepID=A0A815L8F1_ADIRI|nr:unnamed protein product [Adineta ricciae]
MNNDVIEAKYSMSDKFRDNFVGEKGYEALKTLTRGGNELSKDIAKCLQERNEAEIAYVRALRKNSDSLQKLAGRAKGSISLTLRTLSSQTSKQSDAHSMIADVLLQDMSMPIRNFAEAQLKEIKSIEETLNSKFKEWNAQKDNDNKYRSRQFDKSKEIEALNNKISEISKQGRVSSKDTSKLDTSVRKAEEDLKSIEHKYHISTRDVEIARQACDAEMCRSCDQFEKIELNRIGEMGNFIGKFADTMKVVGETMQQVSEDLHAIRIEPENDIVTEARANNQQPETEILLYDVYAENMDNTMSEQRRKLSLLNWIEILRHDIEIQKQTSAPRLSSLASAPASRALKDESLDDDLGMAGDGAMCSMRSKKSVPEDAKDDSSSSNDDDGGMSHRKCKKQEKNGTEVTQKFSSEKFIDRRSVELLLCLYEASLYKIECVYNRLMKLAQPQQYEYTSRITRTFNEKGTPTTLIRIPFQPTTHTPPSAPTAMLYFARAMPMQPESMVQSALHPMARSVQGQSSNSGWGLPSPPQVEQAVPDTQLLTSQPPYSVSTAPTAPEMPRSNPVAHVRALHPYKARRRDELDLEKGDVILLLETRNDGWFKGNLHNAVGLFPGNYVERIS